MISTPLTAIVRPLRSRIPQWCPTTMLMKLNTPAYPYTPPIGRLFADDHTTDVSRFGCHAHLHHTKRLILTPTCVQHRFSPHGHG